MTRLTVRPVQEADREQWAILYRGYRDFYEKPHRAEVIDTVWSWLMDPSHQTRGLVADQGSTLVGLGHYRLFARPIDAACGMYLDDLFTAPAARGTGAGTAILRRLAEIAAEEHATVVRWITAEGNAIARSLYDRVATKTPWVTYDLQPETVNERGIAGISA